MFLVFVYLVLVSTLEFGRAFTDTCWGHASKTGETEGEARKVVLAVPSPFHTVHRTEHWGVIPDLQALYPVHLDVDNVNKVRAAGQILSGAFSSNPWSSARSGICFPLSKSSLSNYQGRNTCFQ